MSKSFYSIGIVLAVIFFFVCGYYFVEADKATVRMYASYLDDLASKYNFDPGPTRDEVSTEVGLWSLLFFAYFIAMDLIGLMKVKTKAMKTISILGLSISGIFLLWNFAMLSAPSSMSFDEIGSAWLVYCVIIMTIAILGLRQNVKYNNSINGEFSTNTKEKLKEDTSDLLDS